MEFFEAIEKRHSVRAYLNKQADEEDIRRILEAVRTAPTAGNYQAFEVYVVRPREARRELAGAAGGQEFLVQAPIVLVFCADTKRLVEKYGRRGAEFYCIQDATIACTFAMLSATALQLSTVWVGAFDPDAVRRIIRAPAHMLPVALLPVGHPAEIPQPTSRRPLSSIVREVGH
jgi:nitroreductase